MSRIRRTVVVAGALAAASMVLAGCQPEPAGPLTTMPVPSSTPSPTATATVPQETVQPVGEPVTVVGGLAAPWSIVRLESGSTLISERDSGVVKELTPDGALRDAAVIPGVVSSGEGGLMGLEFVSARMPAPRATGSTRCSPRRATTVSCGSRCRERRAATRSARARTSSRACAKAGNHNGGRIKLGPDGMLYITIGDASDAAHSQQLGDLNGKILRIDLDGVDSRGQPVPGLADLVARTPQPAGHRLGCATGSSGRPSSARTPGTSSTSSRPARTTAGPSSRERPSDPAFTNPAYQWSTSDASPSGLAYVRGTFFMAALARRAAVGDLPDSGGHDRGRVLQRAVRADPGCHGWPRRHPVAAHQQHRWPRESHRG